MRFLLALLLCLLTLPAHAGPGQVRALAVMDIGPQPWTDNTINGYTGVNTITVADTGTDSGVTGTGNISIGASCYTEAGAEALASVYLVVDGVTVATHSCGPAEDYSQTLSCAVTAGVHTVRVYAEAVDGVGSASSFVIPAP